MSFVEKMVNRAFPVEDRAQTPGLVIMLLCMLVVLALVAGVVLLGGYNWGILMPKGSISEQQSDLLWFATGLSMVVIIPVFILTIAISLRYRQGNPQHVTYTPDWEGSRIAEAIWWGFPILIILILSVVTYRTSFALDPYKPIVSDKEPLTVQVVAMEWKWLFIYPEQDIATVNYLQIPIDRPINFEITADAPMNAFWIPQLGGMVYAMNGMESQLHLMATEEGSYMGRSSNISGEGFSKMTFETRATNQRGFDAWASGVAQTNNFLDTQKYEALAVPGVVEEPISYSGKSPMLYDKIKAKYPSHNHGGGFWGVEAKKNTIEEKHHNDHSHH